MFDVTISGVKLDLSFFDKPALIIKKFWEGIPKWLRYILIITIIVGFCYFIYNKVIITSDMEGLKNEVAELNKIALSSVIYDRYSYDISNIVITVKTIEQLINDIYSNDEDLYKIISTHLKQENPDDPLLKELNIIIERKKLQKESLEKIIDYQINMYENIDLKNTKNTKQTNTKKETEK